MTQRTIIMSERGANEIHFMTTELTERAEKAEVRIKELEATLKTLAAQAMYAAGYTKKGDWKNETL